MKIEKQQKLVDVVKYVAFDGKVFDNESSCEDYEKLHMKIPLYKQLSVSQELASYWPEYDELHSAHCEDTDITRSLNAYTQAIVHEVLRALWVKNQYGPEDKSKDVSDESFLSMHFGFSD